MTAFVGTSRGINAPNLAVVGRLVAIECTQGRREMNMKMNMEALKALELKLTEYSKENGAIAEHESSNQNCHCSAGDCFGACSGTCIGSCRGCA